MAVSAGSIAMTLGRGTIDVSAVESIEDIRNALGALSKVFVGMGYASAAQGSDTVYQNVIYRDGNFYGGKPSDPTNPDLLMASGSFATEAFKTIVVAGQSDVVADSAADTLELEAGANITITTTPGSDKITIAASGSTGYGTIQEEGTPLTQRATINFIGASVTAVDDAGNSRTNVTIVDNDTTYSAGDGLDLTGTVFSTDLAANKGLEIISTELAAKVYADSHLELDANGIGINWNGLPGFVDGNKQTLTKDASASLPNYPEWVDSPQKVIWGIDPDGGHTLDASGTSLILTLKVTKYTFDAVNFVSAVDQDVAITYADGTECP